MPEQWSGLKQPFRFQQTIPVVLLPLRRRVRAGSSARATLRGSTRWLGTCQPRRKVAQSAKRPAKHLCLRAFWLVAGTGFEPVTFRL